MSVINFIKAGKTQSEAALHFKVSRPMVNKIMKESDLIAGQVEESRANACKKSRRLALSNCLEDMLHEWHVRVEIDAPDLNVTGEVLQSKAKEFRDKLLKDYADGFTPTLKQYLIEFKASNGWLQKYLTRKGTTSMRRCGEHSSVDPQPIEKRLADIQQRLENVPLEDIWNIDEFALQHRTTSSRSYVTINNDGRGVKRCKDRITVTPIVSAAGEKLIVQVIGKWKQPRALKNIDINSTYNVVYDHQVKAWQDGSSMLRLFHRIKREARRRHRRFYILLDNCSSHVFAARMLDPTGSVLTSFTFEDTITILFLPPNATSSCQPLDQGIIRSLKAGYRKAQLSTLLSEYELWQNSRDLTCTVRFPVHQHTHMRNTLRWLQEAHGNLSENTIRRCFVKANILPLDSAAEANSNILRLSSIIGDKDENVIDLISMLSSIQVHDDLAQSLGIAGDVSQQSTELVEFDKDAPTGSSGVDTNEIIENVLSTLANVRNAIGSDDDDDDIVELVSVESAITALETVRNYISYCNPTSACSQTFVRSNNLHEVLLELQNRLLKDRNSNKLNNLHQSSIESFLDEYRD